MNPDKIAKIGRDGRIHLSAKLLRALGIPETVIKQYKSGMKGDDEAEFWVRLNIQGHRIIMELNR